METTVAPADTTVANGDAVPDEMLPDGWKSHKDDQGATYYYHDKSRETTWDPPEMSVEEHELKAGKLRRMLYKFIAEVLLLRAKSQNCPAASELKLTIELEKYQKYRTKMLD